MNSAYRAGMSKTLLMPREVDRILRYPRGRSLKLAKAGRLAFIRLPDGEIRFDQSVIEKITTSVEAECEKVTCAHA